MQRFQRVYAIGSFTRGGRHEGWQMVRGSEPEWPIKELYEMWLMFAMIRDLPEGNRQ